ncbi:MAG TPA: HNH endonuclease [Desulfuromonadales bacterium]|nr:HNH endonuclease [Desulfuromonadales bacterium]
MDHFVIEASEEEIKREREKSRELRRSRWWQNRLALGLCHYCGNKFTASELTMDHLVPVSRGGKASRNNVVPACKDCNTRKKYLLPIEWEEHIRQHERPKEDGE